MKYRLVPFTGEWEAAAGRFNARLQASGQAPFLLPEIAAPYSVPGLIHKQHQLVVDEGDEVRGSCLLQRQPAWVNGEETEAVNVQSPLSEGLFDRRQMSLAPWLVRELVRRFPFSYSVGMGGEQMPFPRLVKGLGWQIRTAPFHFRVFKGRSFLANMQPLRRHPKLGWIAAVGGAIPLLPDMAFGALHGWRKNKTAPASSGKKAPSWVELRPRYGFAIERTPSMLEALYPSSDQHFIRLDVPGAAGVLRIVPFQGHSYFGDLVVATLVEAFCQPGAERAFLQAAADQARARGAGLLVTNQTAPELLQALADEGWLSYQSNFLVALSPPLAKSIGEQPIYVNRGDGDGLLNL